MQKIKETLQRTARRRKAAPKRDSPKSPAHTSRGTATTSCIRKTGKRGRAQLLDRMTGRQSRRKPLDRVIKGQEMAGLSATMSKSCHKKVHRRKTDRKNSIRKKILLDRVTKRGKMEKPPMSIKTVLNKPPMNIKTVLNKLPMNAKMVFPRLETLLRRKPTKIRENSR